MKIPQGYTKTDLISAIVVIMFSIFVLIIIASPSSELGKEYDNIRHDDIRDYTEALYEMYNTDPEGFEIIRDQLSAFPVMIGTAESCAGYYGKQCPDSLLRDDCLDLTNQLSPTYLRNLPVDPKNRIFSKEKTGYYILIENDILQVGACAPFGPGSILLQSQLY
ncbi:MAG: hypothetical protein ABH846_00080 [Patescibacteria group bacterium]